MKKVFILILLLCNFYIFAQNQTDTISIKRRKIFVQNNKSLTPKSLLYITQNNVEAHKEIKIATTRNNVVIGLCGLSGLLFTSLFSKTPNWYVVGVGVGLIGVSIPFSRSYLRHAKRGVFIYNNELKQKR